MDLRGELTVRGALSGALRPTGVVSGSIRAGPLHGTLSPRGALSGAVAVRAGLSGALTIRGGMEASVGVGSLPTRRIYPGPFVVTPLRQQAQTLPTGGYECIEDITVEAIPSNYGRITRVGMSLRVD